MQAASRNRQLENKIHKMSTNVGMDIQLKMPLSSIEVTLKILCLKWRELKTYCIHPYGYIIGNRPKTP